MWVTLFHELPLSSAQKTPDAPALQYQDSNLTYAGLLQAIEKNAAALMACGIKTGERVAIYLEKRLETVTAIYGTSFCGAVFVPINPLLKAEQVAHILRDCNVRLLVTSKERLASLHDVLTSCPDLCTVLVIGLEVEETAGSLHLVPWRAALDAPSHPVRRRIDNDVAAILYTSGSTGKPKGVVLSHRNIVTGAISVAQYLENDAADKILSVLPLSFDYGLSQLNTAFLTGACAVLMNYLLPRDIIKAVERHAITGLAAVPPLWIQLSQLEWPAQVSEHLRYVTNSGGAMPVATLNALRKALPKTQVFLMYGLTEAFRSTYLPPQELDWRPESMGRAIPNAEILVVREDGSSCLPNEPGELVHRGPLVALGYWNDREKTAEHFKPVPHPDAALPLTEMAVWSGDTVRMDEQGFLYFISRRDEMIKTSGYRVSPSEVEEVVYSSNLVAEAVAIGTPHPVLGQAIIVVATPKSNQRLDSDALMAACKKMLPAFMIPARIEAWVGDLPRNANGKIDRKFLAATFSTAFLETANE